MNKNVVFLMQYKIFKTENEIYDYFKLEMNLLRKEKIEFTTAIVAGSDEEIIKQLSKANIVLCWGNPNLNNNIISSLPNLDIILRYGVGTNSIDIESASDNDIVVFNLPDCSKAELAYHALSLILSNLRNIVRYDRNMRSGIWDKGGGPKPRRLENLIVGLYGLGNSGSDLSKMLINGFGTKVIASDPYISVDLAKKLGVTLVDFDDMVKMSDIISIHAPLTSETHYKFNKDIFCKMKSDAMLINVSRGPIVNISDLCEALKNGAIRCCGLDVFEEEPMPKEHELLRLENTILTPHSAYYGLESELQMNEDAALILEQLLINKKLIRKYIVNKDIIKKLSSYEIV